MAEVTQRYHTQREIVTHARYLARQAVRQHWKEQGRRQWDYSQKELSETANEYLRLRPELIELARAKLSTDAQKPRSSNQSGISVQKSRSKWWRLG